MLDSTPRTPDAVLSVAALRYAAGEMPPAEAVAFEDRLADDQTARDALAEAVRLSAAASGAPVPKPDPLVRRAAVERLHPTWLSRLFPRRPYRGHPAVWAMMGGIAAAVAVAVTVDMSRQQEPVVAQSQPTSVVAVILPLSPRDLPSRAVSPPPQQAVTDKPTPTRLNPMGMDKRVVDATPAGPSPLLNSQAPMAAPKPMPAVKAGDDKLAEGNNDANPPMAEPAVGTTMSKL